MYKLGLYYILKINIYTGKLEITNNRLFNPAYNS
jgi:hypothetical protein